jgi:hypothetical protein
LHNISPATAFRKLYVVLTNLDGVRSKFTSADIQYEEPAHASKERKTVAEFRDTWAGVLVTELQPKNAVRLVTQIEGPDRPVVRCDSATDAVHLVKDGWSTFAVEYEITILLSLAVALVVILVFYVVFLSRTRPVATAVGTLVIMVSLTCTASSSPGIIHVVDEKTGQGVPCEIYREDVNASRQRAAATDPRGTCIVYEKGKPGERYVALSEEYNPGYAQCPLGTVTIRVRRTTLLRDHIAKAEFLESAGQDAAAALEFRKAALLAEGNPDKTLFNQLEYRVATKVAQVLRVEQPFVTTGAGTQPSSELRTMVETYQASRNLTPNGALSTDTIRDMVVKIPVPTSRTVRNYPTQVAPVILTPSAYSRSPASLNR